MTSECTPAPQSRSASAGSHTTSRENPPRRLAPAPASPPAAPPGPGPSVCPVAARRHLASGFPAAAPATVGSCLLGARLGLRRAFAPHQLLRPPPGSPDPPRPLPDSSAPAPTPPGGRHSSRSGRTGHESAAPATAWPPRIAGVGVVALCRLASALRGDWTGFHRPCPRAYLRYQRDQSRGASRFHAPLPPRRTPAALRSLSPSAYRTGLC